jgi:hypothetical protein
VEFHDGDQERVEIEILFRPIARAAQRTEPGGARKFEQSGHSFRPRPSGRGGNGHYYSSLSVPSVHRAEPPRPATHPAPASAANPGAPKQDATSAPVVRTPPPPVAPQPAPLTVTGKPSPSVPSSAVPSGADAKAKS